MFSKNVRLKKLFKKISYKEKYFSRKFSVKRKYFQKKVIYKKKIFPNFLKKEKKNQNCLYKKKFQKFFENSSVKRKYFKI